MNRALTICILCVFLGYSIVLFSSINALGTNKIPYVRQKLRTVRMFAGAGSLFTREISLDNYATLYRCYQNNKWNNWQQLERPLFEAYINQLSFTSLKHNRLDIHLSQGLYFKGYLLYKNNFTQSKGYQSFIKHLVFAHYNNIKPDSVEVVYQKKLIDSLGNHIPKQLLRFKAAL